MLDPVKNAKVFGVILFIIGLIDLKLSLNVLVLANPVTSLFVGYGLYNHKLWGVYGIGIIAVLKAILAMVAISMDIYIGSGTALVIILYVVLFLWFYSERRKFSKT